MQIKACIGLGYGDEGKGMWVDQLARTSDTPLVIRANSGGQVGHTVYRGEERFIFSHLGSGSLTGAPTLFTRDTVVNPVLFVDETSKRNAGVPYQVFIDLDCPVSTPYDMLLNQALEVRRGRDNHGSVGVGFGVTLEREEAGVRFRYSDVRGGMIHNKIAAVRQWCLDRLGPQQESENEFIEQVYRFFKTDEIMGLFKEDCYKFFKATSPATNINIRDFKTLIFENGQGLQLDQEYGAFPYVTRSNTGFRNIGKFLKRNNLFENDQSQVDVYYLSRCYTTRHGAGPLPFERDQLPGFNIVDETNKTNRFQGSLRLAPLNLMAITRAIEWDKQSHPRCSRIHKVVTCCDQIRPEAYNIIEYVFDQGAPRLVNNEQFLASLNNFFDVIVSSPHGI